MRVRLGPEVVRHEEPTPVEEIRGEFGCLVVANDTRGRRGYELRNERDEHALIVRDSEPIEEEGSHLGGISLASRRLHDRTDNRTGCLDLAGADLLGDVWLGR